MNRNTLHTLKQNETNAVVLKGTLPNACIITKHLTGTFTSNGSLYIILPTKQCKNSVLCRFKSPISFHFKLCTPLLNSINGYFGFIQWMKCKANNNNVQYFYDWTILKCVVRVKESLRAPLNILLFHCSFKKSFICFHFQRLFPK